jgi:hypothetical protein
MRCRARESLSTALSDCTEQNNKEDKANGAEEEDEGKVKLSL